MPPLNFYGAGLNEFVYNLLGEIFKISKIKSMFNNWFVLGIGSSLCFSAMILVYKKLLLMGMKPLVLNLFLFGFVFVGFAIWNFSTKTAPDLNLKMILFLLLASAFSLMGNYLYTTAVKLAPNPGYASTLKATQIIFISLLAPIFFKSSFGLVPFFGIIFVLIGIFLLSK